MTNEKTCTYDLTVFNVEMQANILHNAKNKIFRKLVDFLKKEDVFDPAKTPMLRKDKKTKDFEERLTKAKEEALDEVLALRSIVLPIQINKEALPPETHDSLPDIVTLDREDFAFVVDFESGAARVEINKGE